MRIGQVSGIRVVDSAVAEVTFTVTEEVPLAIGVRATIRYRNLVGQRYLALREGPGEARPLRPGGAPVEPSSDWSSPSCSCWAPWPSS